MKVKIKKLNELAIVPKYAKPGDAGLDLTATSYTFENNRHIYGTGLAIEIPKGYVGLIFPRSSICKKDLRLTNSVGVIDSGFRGEIKFFFENDAMIKTEHYTETEIYSTYEFEKSNYRTAMYNVGDRIGQIVILPYPQIEFKEVTDLSETERGESGFGSSGT